MNTPYEEVTQQINEALQADLSADQLIGEYQSKMREAMLNFRLRSGMTARAFGALDGVSKAYIYSLEKGDRVWNRSLVERICKSIMP